MSERYVVVDDPGVTGESEALRAANERADRAEAELRALKGETTQPTPAGHLVEPGSMDAAKQPATPTPAGHAAGSPQESGIAALREDTMMRHLLDSLAAGKDIGHYGRLVFAMIARHFINNAEIIAELTKDKDFSEEEAATMVMQVEGHDYSPPRRERILEWQAEQEFPIIPDAADPDGGNVYKSLRFPKELYAHISDYREQKAEAEEKHKLNEEA